VQLSNERHLVRVCPAHERSISFLRCLIFIENRWIAVAIWREKWNWFSLETMSAKDILLEVAEKLPPEATLNDAIYELEFRQAVQQGLDELDRGEGIPIEQVKAQIASWAGK
jgi:predicted transcriptional regulator